MQETGRLFSCCPSVLYKNGEKRNSIKCTLGAFLHLLLRPIFRQLHPNFINVRTAYASEIWAQLTKNHLTKTSTERFREYIVFCKWCSLLFIVSFPKKKAMARIVEHIAKVAAVGRKKQNQPTSVISNIFLV